MIKISTIAIAILVSVSLTSFAQFQFLSPLPGSKNLNPEQNIIIREGGVMDPLSLKQNLFTIRGSISGVHDFKIILCSDGKTINLNPVIPFAFGETVTVTIESGLVTMTTKKAEGFVFSFTTHRAWTNEELTAMAQLKTILLHQEIEKWGPDDHDVSADTRSWENLLTVNNNSNPSAGDVFFDAWSGTFIGNEFDGYYCMDVNGDSVYAKNLSSGPNDFQLGKNGLFDVFRGDLGRFDVLDSNFVVVNKYYAANGYGTNNHELHQVANGNAFLIADEFQIVDMTVYNPDYVPNATILGSVIQEFDPNHNVLFQWRSFDHVLVTEAEHENLAYGYIDYMHTNAIDQDADGNLLVSHRHLDQITKIDLNTGEFIWRLGGINNDFTFTNDPAQFTYQHDIRRIANGNITLYDDGNYHTPNKSFAKEYQLDEINKKATLVWSYSHPDVNGVTAYYFAMGSMQRLSNGNTFIGWGWRSNTGLPSFTEVTPSGNIVWEARLRSGSNVVSYRAHKYEWDICARPTFKKMITQNITMNTAQLKWAPVANVTEQYVVQYKKHSGNTWTEKVIASNKHAIVLHGLSPATKYDWRLQSLCDTAANTSSAYTQVKIFSTLPMKTLQQTSGNKIQVSVYPNPAHDVISIECDAPVTALTIVNLLGQQIKSFTPDKLTSPLSVGVQDLEPGNYFAKITMGSESKVLEFVIE